MPQSNNGKIAVRPHQKPIQTSELDKKLIGFGSTYLSSEGSRSTEDDALANLGPIPILNELQKEIALLERMGRDPEFMPDHPTRGRYKIAIYGKALWAWIGRQPGITLRATEVEKMLKAISDIQKVRAEMGFND